MNNEVDIIIPSYNEGRNLERTLNAILNYSRNSIFHYNILVVDNGSEDDSQEIAKNFATSVVVKPGVSIAELRNVGASLLSGDIIAFLDGDVEVTEGWFDALSFFADHAVSETNIVTGATVLRPPNSSLIEKLWFNGKNFSKNYINSGNLVTTREFFNRVGGFNPVLKSGEDWDFCSRAVLKGGTVKINPNFKAYHHGFPKTLSAFFRREIWHGEGDFISLSCFKKSKPALLAVFNGIFLMIWAGACYISNNLFVFISYPIWLFMISLYISYKRSEAIWQIPGNMILAVTYIFGRLGACIKKLVYLSRISK
jgi:glycosyltransferase involved in cell wall biosynthesis